MSNPRASSNKTAEPAATGPGPGIESVGNPPKKPFRELYSRDELWYYGSAAITYITLGVLVRDVVLNWIVGPLFIVAWMWWMPVLVGKWRTRRYELGSPRT